MNKENIPYDVEIHTLSDSVRVRPIIDTTSRFS